MVKASDEPSGIPEKTRSLLWNCAIDVESDTLDAHAPMSLMADVVDSMERYGRESESPSVKDEMDRRAGQLRYLLGDISQRFDRLDKANRKIYSILRDGRSIPIP